MSDLQSYEQRVTRLAYARRKDSAAKRAAVLKAIADLRREDRAISRRVVIARAGVHRNFLQRHKDLAALIDDAAGGQRPEHHPRPEDRLTRQSLVVELSRLKHRNRQLEQKLRVLERQLGAQGSSLGPALLDQHPVIVELRNRLAHSERDVTEKSRTVSSLEQDIEVLRETNRSLVREYGLTHRPEMAE
jgi:hypothetical protein